MMKAYSAKDLWAYEDMLYTLQSALNTAKVYEVFTKDEVIAMLTELRQEIDIMSDTVVESRTITVTSWKGMQKRICNLIQSKIDKLKENSNETNKSDK